MLPLDSPRWSQLTHAYGSADDIPLLLQAIVKVPYSTDSHSPWQELYDALCHQFSIETASYAAFPYLISFAEKAKGKARCEFLDLASAIEAIRHIPHQPGFPRGLKKAYMDALRRAPMVAEELLADRWDTQQMRSLLGMIAIFRGHPKLGFSLQCSTDDVECQACGHIQKPPYYEEFEP